MAIPVLGVWMTPTRLRLTRRIVTIGHPAAGVTIIAFGGRGLAASRPHSRTL